VIKTKLKPVGQQSWKHGLLTAGPQNSPFLPQRWPKPLCTLC